MTSVWDDPELRVGGEFVKLENKGDKIGGTILAVRSHKFEDGSVAAQVIFTDKVGGTGDEKTWTAGQIQAKRKLAELRPEAGDDFTAELMDVERRAGGKTLKHIDVQVWRGGRKPGTASDERTLPRAEALAGVGREPTRSGTVKEALGLPDDEPPF